MRAALVAAVAAGRSNVLAADVWAVLDHVHHRHGLSVLERKTPICLSALVRCTALTATPATGAPMTLGHRLGLVNAGEISRERCNLDSAEESGP
jgi:hypothetical protein